MMRQRLLVSCLAAFVSLCVVPSAGASSIIQLQPFSGAAGGVFAVDPFDPALGTLDSITVAINGVLTVSGTTALNLLPLGPNGAPVPVPYQFQIDVDQEFDGLAGKYFHFNSPGHLVLPGLTASGAGELFSVASTFGYQFTLNASSDLVGFVIPLTSSSVGSLVPPASGITGLRDDFLLSLVPLDQIQFIQSASGSAASAPPPIVTGLVTAGALQMQYNYTPAAAAVPEPGTLMLLGGGVLVAGASRLRKSRGRASRAAASR